MCLHALKRPHWLDIPRTRFFFMTASLIKPFAKKSFPRGENRGLKRLLRRFSPQFEKRPYVTKEVRRGLPELLPRLRRFSYALTGNPDRGDDLVQETCVRALARADQWQPGTRLDSWMFKIMKIAPLVDLKAMAREKEERDIGV